MAMPAAVSDRRRSIVEFDQAIVNLSARINASTYELLVLIREFDERAEWLKWELASCSQWLHWRCDLSRSTARAKVRVAHALKNLPGISIAFSEGRLSYSKVRALTRVVTPANEGALVCQALDKAVEAADAQGPEFEEVPWGTQQADALVVLARSYLNGGTDTSASTADSYQVVVHVDGVGREPLRVGRKQRTVPAALKRALWLRDGG